MSDQSISVCVKLSRNADFPGAVVGGMITLDRINASDEGAYLSFISVQV